VPAGHAQYCGWGGKGISEDAGGEDKSLGKMTSDVRAVAMPTAGHEASDQTHGWEAEPSLVQGILAWSRGGVSSAAATWPGFGTRTRGGRGGMWRWKGEERQEMGILKG